MSAFSNDLERRILNATLRGSNYTSPSNVYVALFTTAPTDEATGDELTDSAYVRQDAAQGDTIASGWTEPVVQGEGHMCSNAKRIQFPPVADGTVTVGWFGLFDSMTGGNLLYHGAFTVPKTLEINDVVSIDIGGLKVILR